MSDERNPQAPTIRMRGIERWFGDAHALRGFDLDVDEGTLLTLLGPSGSGKTTALRLLAGFDRPDWGTIEIDGVPIVTPGVFVAPEKRRVGMVFQDYALFPHLTVARNVGYGVRKASRNRRVAEVLELVGLDDKAGRLPHELSGGEQQRVALARALAPEPRVILLDEPFSNLDAALRGRVRAEVAEILRRSGTTAIFVTHDQEEALAMSDVLAVMRDGRIMQMAPPDEVYRSPAEPWIAGFLGDADFVPGHARRGKVDTPFGSFGTDLDGPVTVMIRPEHVHLVPDEDGDAVVTGREFYGHDQLLTLALPGGVRLRSRLGPRTSIDLDDRVWVKVETAVAFPG